MKSLVIGIGIIGAILLASLASENPSAMRLPKDASVTPITEEDIAIDKAKKLFKEKKLAGISMADGPCLNEKIIPDWCVDVAHHPRVNKDNDPQNQCKSYLEGITHNCVELDEKGNLIRIVERS